MTDEDLKQIRSVVKEEIDSSLIPVKKTLDAHTQILDKHTQILDRHTQKLEALWDQVVDLSEDMTEIKITLRSNTVDLDQTKKRVTVVEDHLGL